VVGQVAHRPDDAPPPQSVQAALAVGGHVPLDGGPTESGDLGRLGPGDAAVEQPKDEHLAADVGVGVGIPLRVDDRLLGIREGDP
jgi:hypothetical protein